MASFGAVTGRHVTTDVSPHVWPMHCRSAQARLHCCPSKITLLRSKGCAASPDMSFSSPFISSITILWPWYAKPMPSYRDKQLHERLSQGHVHHNERMQLFMHDCIGGIWSGHPIHRHTGLAHRGVRGFDSCENEVKKEGLTM